MSFLTKKSTFQEDKMKSNGLTRFLSLTLCLCMLLGMVPAFAPVTAEAVPTRNGSDNTITIDMHDSYGDGWGGNAINVLENGVQIDSATILTGKDGTWTYTMNPDCEYAFVWVKGAWSSECFFEIYIGGEPVFTATTTDCNLFAHGKVLYPLCEHPQCDAVVTPATCKKDGYTTFTCITCGFTYVGDETPATGHIFGDDDFCDNCGFDINSIRLDISMSDSFGDGWNGNAILVYEDGVLIETVTLESGERNRVWSYDLDVNKAYDFYWLKGNFPNECSFTISYDDEVVYTATQSMCSSFKENHLIYPPCQHINTEAEVTAPTCTQFGYTTYTCTKCGNATLGDVVLATGHSYGDDSVCDTCGYDKDGITINMTDTYGDGWGTNVIEIYADGVLVGKACLDGGNEGTFFLAVDKTKEYTFHWVKGYSTYECGFEILMAGETVFSATGSECDKFISGQQVYPVVAYSGWVQLGGKVYYFDPVTHAPVSGVNRLPYPTMAINGITYGPDPEDVAYFESLGQTFIDLNDALFFFDSYTCEFKSGSTGVWSVQVADTYGYRYIENGMIPWHVGMVKEYGYYYYFAGDDTYGGNFAVKGDAEVFRNNSDFDMVVGGVYTFDWMNHLCLYDGITSVDGVLRYYENAQLMVGNGLTQVGENFIFVDENGDLIVNTEFYVPVNDLDVAAGTYTFDENGYLLNPISASKNGVFFENGSWYFYEKDKISYNKGLIAYDGGYIYVRSNGMLATGTYYITNVPEELSGIFFSGQKMFFDENGFAQPVKNGICEVDGKLYYYINNEIQYNAGLIKVDGGYIYVRSNGVVATGEYWITNHNGLLPEETYDFGESGILTVN